MSAPDLRPAMTLSAISRLWPASSFLRRPPTRPPARAAARPAEVRSRIMARSNSAKAPTICIIIRPAGVVVSTLSVSERKPAPAPAIRSMMCSTSFSDRDSRSSFQTTTTSPSRIWSSRRCSSGRSHRPPEAASSKIFRQPAARNARTWRVLVCSSSFDTRAAATAGVVHELEEAEIERQLVLRDAPVRAQPGAQQRPGPFHRVDVDLAEAVAILVARVLPTRVADRHVPVAPGRQAGVAGVLVGVDAGALGDGGLDDRPDGLLPHIGQHAEDQLPAALDQAEDGRLVLRQRAAARRSRQPAAASRAPLFATAAGWPLCPATT